MNKYIPLGKKVVLKKIGKSEEDKKGKIMLLSSPKDPLIAEVIYTGNLVSDSIKVNSMVRYAPFTSHVIDDENPNIIIIDEKDIWCIVEKS